MRGVSVLSLTMVLLALGSAAWAQTHYRVTQGWCAQNGGTFRATGQVGTDIGECTILPRVGPTPGGGGSGGGGGMGAYGAIYNMLGVMRSMLPSDNGGQALFEQSYKLNELGNAAMQGGDCRMALTYFQQAVEGWASLGHGENVTISGNNARNAEACVAAEDRRQQQERQRQQEAAEQRQRAEEMRRRLGAQNPFAGSGPAAPQTTNPFAASAPAREPFNCGPGPHPPDVVGCYDLGAKPSPKGTPDKTSLRDDLRKKLAVKKAPVRADETAATGPAAAEDEPPDEATAATSAEAPTPARPSDAAPPPGHRRDVLTESQCKTRGGRFFTPDGQTMPVCDYPATPAFTMKDAE